MIMKPEVRRRIEEILIFVENFSIPSNLEQFSKNNYKWSWFLIVKKSLERYERV